MQNFILLSFLSVLLFSQNSLFTQNPIVDLHLQEVAAIEGLSSTDIQNYTITNAHTSSRSNITHYYVRQKLSDLEIFGTQSSVHTTSDNELFKFNNAFIKDIDQRIGATSESLTHEQIIEIVVNAFGYDDSDFPIVLEESNASDKQRLYSGGSISQESIPMKIMYYLDESETLQLCYDLSIYEADYTDWWSLKVDANTGQIVSQINWTLECNFNHAMSEEHKHHIHSEACHSISRKSNTATTGTYNVYPTPVESPNHGIRSLIVDPVNLTASPFGWHDTDGVTGPESTQTRGNNVNAQEDENGNNGTGFAPDGNNALVFDFPIDFNLPPTDNRDASLSNLFYWNNVIHDVFYLYGFDEAAGNFQENNYGNGGNGSDRVNADGLDGSGTNNANFSTPPDGGNPRMQMFLWSAGSVSATSINAPEEIVGDITGIIANYGPASFSLTEDIVLADDGSANPTEGCNAFVNAADINGKIALIDRGNCEFGVKSLNAENAGAIGVIVCQNSTAPPFGMGPGAVGNTVTIPSIMISMQDCDSIKTYLPNVNISLSASSTNQPIDGSFDNGIIAHEYGHGISIRLTGGASNSGCLNNTEQMGEGWSDYFGMLMTIESGDVGTDRRGVGTYALTQPTTGSGIRDFPYSTDLGVDPRTYNSINTASIPHGVGSVWCAMLWEMTWALIDEHGFDPDLYNGVGGNNIALALVTEALKLQPCSPGFVDGRDAILAADLALYGGQNECLIWGAFAKRGLGFGASQGSSGSRSDGTESFMTPTSCQSVDMAKTVNSDSIIAGDTLTYALTFDNQTSATYTNLVVSDTLLECLSYVSGSATGGATHSNGVVELTVPIVDPFTSVEIQFQAKVEGNITGTTQEFIDDVEGSDILWFTFNESNPTQVWTIDDTDPFSGSQNWFAENQQQRGTNRLVLKSSKKLTATSELRFWHTYSSLSNLDGGRVEISIDNQNTWTDLDSYFTQNGYDDFVLTDPNLPAFGGTNNTGYVQTIADLNSFAGEYAHIRFTMFLSSNAPGFGWRVDDIEISNIEKSVSNIGYFTASPGIDEEINIFPPTDVISATCMDGIQNGNETGIDTGGNCPGGPCDFDLVLSGDPAPSDTYQVENQITSTANVGPNTNYFASTILLENNFEVEVGNEFLAEINPCTAFSNDGEVALKIVSSDKVQNEFNVIIDVNIPQEGEYLINLESTDTKMINLHKSTLAKGVHRITLKTKQDITDKQLQIVKQ